jgi:hypothetical protein
MFRKTKGAFTLSSKQSREFYLLDDFARRLFDKFASSKAAKAAFLLDEQTRRLN